jgi:hypothetical protein
MAYAKAGQYIQKSIRIDGRVTTQYLGCDQFAAHLADLDGIIRRDLERQRLERLEGETEHRRLI